METIMVTGCAGFIGYHLAERLLGDGARVSGLDVLDDAYEPALKQARLERLLRHPRFTFRRADVATPDAFEDALCAAPPQRVVHLAARAGVRASVIAPRAFTHSNLVGFANVVEACARARVGHLVYASSSSVYGAKDRLPFAETDGADGPVSYYAATKKANELMAHAFSAVAGLPATGLRFFTVYGPWGRPDMAPILFARAILRGDPIRVFNRGRMLRDFTYVDDVVDAIVHVLSRPPDAAGGRPPHRVLNVGSSRSVELGTFIRKLESLLGRTAVRLYAPMQPGDVPATCASTAALQALTGFVPRTPLDEGLRRMADWLVEWDRPAARTVRPAVDEVPF